MQIGRVYMVFVAALILASLSACSFTTANISSLKVTRDENGENETSTFGPRDNIYATATVSNVPSKVTLKWQLIAEKVEGQPENYHVAALDKSFDFPKSGSTTYTLSPPPAGWPAGKYRIEALMFIESGEKKDQKTVNFTVANVRE